VSTRFLPVRLTLPIPGVDDDWPELLLPQGMDSASWDRMVSLLDVMRPAVVAQGDRRPLIKRLATAINQARETKESRR
jgi:hypothetical protein